MTRRNRIDIYTDGSCSGNPGIGGWASLIMINGDTIVSCGSDEDTTNNRMELKAFISGLEMAVSAKLDDPSLEITIYTDSKYIENPITHRWIDRWKRNNFKGIKNVDLWSEIIQILSVLDIDVKWVKGHDSSEQNNIIDRIAKEARDGLYGKRATMII